MLKVNESPGSGPGPGPFQPLFSPALVHCLANVVTAKKIYVRYDEPSRKRKNPWHFVYRGSIVSKAIRPEG